MHFPCETRRRYFGFFPVWRNTIGRNSRLGYGEPDWFYLPTLSDYGNRQTDRRRRSFRERDDLAPHSSLKPESLLRRRGHRGIEGGKEEMRWGVSLFLAAVRLSDSPTSSFSV